jgi:hypothetical protein
MSMQLTTPCINVVVRLVHYSAALGNDMAKKKKRRQSLFVPHFTKMTTRACKVSDGRLRLGRVSHLRRVAVYYGHGPIFSFPNRWLVRAVLGGGGVRMRNIDK